MEEQKVKETKVKKAVRQQNDAEPLKQTHSENEKRNKKVVSKIL